MLRGDPLFAFYKKNAKDKYYELLSNLFYIRRTVQCSILAVEILECICNMKRNERKNCMKNIIKRALSLALALAMMSIPVFAIVPPEDAAPVLSEADLVRLKAKELMQLRMERAKSNATGQELEAFNARESLIYDEIEDLGGEIKNAREIAQTLGHTTHTDGTPLVFEGLIDTDDYRFIEAGPFPTTYNGRTMYYIEVTVVPMNPGNYLWLTVGKETLVNPGTQYGAYKNTALTTSPSSSGANYDGTMSDVFSGISDNADTGLYMDLDIATLPTYVYFAESNPTFEPSYSLGYITTSVECYEIFTIPNYDWHNFPIRWINDEYYGDIDYALSVYFAGHGYEVGCPMSVYYSFGNYYDSGFDIYQPYSWPYMYT